jgi:DNA-binding HxlR family transcriptional regulator
MLEGMAVRTTSRVCLKFQAAVDLLGKRWSMLILQQLLEGPRRYSELADMLDVMSEKMLSERLKELEATGLAERRVIAGHPVRVEYHLTDKGRALGRVIGSLERWADQWMATPAQ